MQEVLTYCILKFGEKTKIMFSALKSLLTEIKTPNTKTVIKCKEIKEIIYVVWPTGSFIQSHSIKQTLGVQV